MNFREAEGEAAGVHRMHGLGGAGGLWVSSEAESGACKDRAGRGQSGRWQSPRSPSSPAQENCPFLEGRAPRSGFYEPERPADHALSLR